MNTRRVFRGCCAEAMVFDNRLEGYLAFVISAILSDTSCSNEVNSQEPFAGTALSYYENGQLALKTNYKNGELDVQEGIKIHS